MTKHRSKEVWWQTYRKRQHKLKNNVSTETILRQAFKETLREYVDNCSVNGVKQMCDPDIGIKQRLIWILVFTTMLAGMFYYIHYIWYGSLNKPLIVTMESSTYPISKIDFPAVALCNINRISKKALVELAKSVYPYLAKHNEPFSEVVEFCRQMGRLIDYTSNSSLRNHHFLRPFTSHLQDSHDIIDRMKKLAPSCDEMLLKCSWAGFDIDCNTIFAVRRTVHGHCCVFNYVLDYESAMNPNHTIAEAKRQNLPGMFYGLSVLLDPMVDDYAYPLYNLYGFEVLLFDPTHFPDPSGGRVIHRTAQPGQFVSYEVYSTKQIATDEVRKYPPSTRECLFHDEKNKKFNNLYSYSACIVHCRIKTVQSLCRCTPYYLPIPHSEGRVCNLDDLQCLNKFKEKLFYLYPKGSTNTDGLEMELIDSLSCVDCLPDCEHTQHYSKHIKIPLLNQDFEHKKFLSLAHGVQNLTGKISLKIYQTTTDGILNRLDVVSYWFEIVSNIGGFYGMLVGFSIVCVIEFCYYFVIRFAARVYRSYVE